MATKKTGKPLFERLKQGLEEAIAWSKAELTLRTIEAAQMAAGGTDRPPTIDETQRNR